MISAPLQAHRLLLRIGLALVHAFAWIFIFEYFYVISGNMSRALAALMLLFAFAQLITLIITPVSAAHLQRGVKRSLIWGSIMAASAFIVLGAALQGFFQTPLLWGIVAFAVLLGLYRALYWIPYKLASFEVTPLVHMRTFFEVLVALMPLFAGLTLANPQFTPSRLLFGAGAMMVLSTIPALFISDTKERFSWPYIYTFKQLFRQKNQGLVLQSIFEGMQSASLFLIWPVAVFLIVEWSYLTLGVVLTATLLAVLVLRRYVRGMLHSLGLRHSPTVHAVIAVSGWVARLSAGTPIGVIIADAYSYSTQPERSTHADPFSFEHASDRGAFIDEYTALKEIAIALGRIGICAIVFLLLFFFALPVVFAISLAATAIAAGISAVIAQKLAPATY